MKFPSLLITVLVAVSSLFTVSCSGDSNGDALTDEEFRHIYAEIVYLGELYRGDTLRLRNSVDSLLEAHDADTAALFAAARRTAKDKELTETLYRETIERFESVTAADTLRGAAGETQARQSGD